MIFPDVIVLNGTSSSGKTTLASALQETLDAIYMHVSIDAFFGAFPQKAFKPEFIEQTGLHGLPGFFRCIAALADTGNKVIVDIVLADKRWAEECVLLLQPFYTLWVGVHCPLEELERREQARGDRKIGMARQQSDEVHLHVPCDIEVDTLESSPAECAAKIKQRLLAPA